MDIYIVKLLIMYFFRYFCMKMCFWGLGPVLFFAASAATQAALQYLQGFEPEPGVFAFATLYTVYFHMFFDNYALITA